MRVGSDRIGSESHSCVETADLFPLLRSPSGKPRFLAKYEHIDCGSGHGIEYAAYDWDSTVPFYQENLRTALHRKGVMPREDVEPTIWNFKTSGRTISLPYCWHSAVDSWAAAHLCSVDAYDLSGDDMRFLSTRTNFPDLETIAHAVLHAQAKDISSARGYCADLKTATSLVQLMPASYIFASGDLKTTPVADNKETVALSTSDSTLKFELVTMQGRWLIANFVVEH